jgi:hypothetical protein
LTAQKKEIFFQKGNLLPKINAQTGKKGKYFSLQKGHK